MEYTYTIFDASPQSSSGTEWPTHTDVELEADSDAEAIEEVRDVMSSQAAGLRTEDGYKVGEYIHAIVWDEDGTIIAQPTHELTYENLGVEPPRTREEALSWARNTNEGDYLAEYANDDLDEESDPGNRCGYDDETLDAIESVLAERSLTLRANDRGLVVEASDAALYAGQCEQIADEMRESAEQWDGKR